MGEVLNFQIDERFANPILSKNLKVYNKYMSNNNNELKFYDPEENMEYLNRLFDVLGVLDTKEIIKNYVELLTVMYTYIHMIIKDKKSHNVCVHIYQIMK